VKDEPIEYSMTIGTGFPAVSVAVPCAVIGGRADTAGATGGGATPLHQRMERVGRRVLSRADVRNGRRYPEATRSALEGSIAIGELLVGLGAPGRLP